MKRVLACLVALILLASAAFAEGMTTYTQGSMSYEVPESWLFNGADGKNYHYAAELYSTEGGYLFTANHEFEDLHWDEAAAHQFVKEAILEIMSGAGYTDTDIDIEYGVLGNFVTGRFGFSSSMGYVDVWIAIYGDESYIVFYTLGNETTSPEQEAFFDTVLASVSIGGIKASAESASEDVVTPTANTVGEHIELSGYIGVMLDEFATAVDIQIHDGYDGFPYASNDDFSVYASSDADDGGNGAVDYISIEGSDIGYSIYGMYLGMTSEEIEAAANAVSMTCSFTTEDTMFYVDSDLKGSVMVRFTDGLATEISGS